MLYAKALTLPIALIATILWPAPEVRAGAGPG